MKENRLKILLCHQLKRKWLLLRFLFCNPQLKVLILLQLNNRVQPQLSLQVLMIQLQRRHQILDIKFPMRNITMRISTRWQDTLTKHSSPNRYYLMNAKLPSIRCFAAQVRVGFYQWSSIALTTWWRLRHNTILNFLRWKINLFTSNSGKYTWEVLSISSFQSSEIVKAKTKS